MLEMLRPSTAAWLTSKYKIIAEFNFFFNDFDPTLFYKWCQQWQSYAFDYNEKIIIFNIDTDYYNEGCPIGNNTYNFFKCCAYFQLPTEFFLYFSPQSGIHAEVQLACKLFNLTSPTVIESLCLPLHAPTEVLNIEFDPTQIKKPFVCLNGLERIHRLLFLSLLKEHQLLDKGIVTYNFSNTTPKQLPSVSSGNRVQSSLVLRTTTPFVRVNETLNWSAYHHQVLKTHAQSFINQSQLYPAIDNASRYQPNILNLGLVYVVTETTVAYPYPWITEKIIKGIISKRPMIILSSPHTLKRLRELGFKTFSEFWSEEYDSIEDASSRMDNIVNIIKDICSMSASEIHSLAEKIRPIVEFNFHHYCENFIEDDNLEIF